MSVAELPGWLRYRIGTRPIVLVAPHGGERTREIRRGDGMNDLFTAELTHELAGRLDAYAVINEGLDRNDVDLNRISAVVERAPTMLRVLCDAVARAGEDAKATPLVLFVHGWNISSLACDIGIGLRESYGSLYGVHATVSPSTLHTFVEPLRDALADRGLEGFVGHRYPASGRDNATQLFSGRHLGHEHAEVDRLARLSLAGRVDAVQLELSIPLRWPGDYRERCLAAAEEAVGKYLAASQRSGAVTVPRRKWAQRQPVARPAATTADETAAAVQGESVQAVLADGSGLFMGVEPVGAGALAARVCIARPDGRLALFVCEAPWDGARDRFSAGGLDWHTRRCVRYAGPAVLYETHDAFVDLEGGLRSASVIDVELEIPLRVPAESIVPTGSYVRVGEETLEVSPLLLPRGGGRFAGQNGVRARLMLIGPDGGIVAIEDGRERPASGPGMAQLAAHAGRIEFGKSGDRLRACAEDADLEVEGSVTVRVPVYRPVPDGGYVHVMFGVAAIVEGSGFGPYGLFEVVRRVRASP